jgi:D-glutamate N-acetyltransferase
MKKALLVDGMSDVAAAKTAINILRYDSESVVAVIASGNDMPRSAQDLLGVGGDVPVLPSVSDVVEADQLILGTTPPGGRITPAWRQAIEIAITRGWDVVSGMHEFLGDDPNLVDLAHRHDARLVDVRKTDFHSVATRHGLREDCLRIHTVGHDSNVGKMVVSFETARALQRSGYDAQFVPTGQTGIMLAGHGIPMDAVVSDFLNGAAEELVRRNQDHDILLIEGQGSVVNPMFSAVTLGLLHGCMPDRRENARFSDRRVPGVSPVRSR